MKGLVVAGASALGGLASLLALASSASAEERWDCTFTTPYLPHGALVHVAIRIDGDGLDWVLDPVDIPELKIHGGPTVFHHRVLVNNEVGIVAVSARAEIDKDVGPVVASETVVIDRRTGALRTGIVEPNGVHEATAGTCHLD